MKPVKYSDLPPNMRRQIDCMFASDRRLKYTDLHNPSIVAHTPRRKMTKTEAEYERRLASEHTQDNVFFQGLTLRMKNGHKYTPDFVVNLGRGNLALYEVKGTYQLKSYQRARLAFDQVRVEWTMFKFVWAEKRKDGTWSES